MSMPGVHVVQTATCALCGHREPTLGQRLIDLVPELAEVCARRPRWQGARDARIPPTCAFGLISAASVAWTEAAAASKHIRLVDVSIEAMATFAAIDASIATGRLQLVIAGAGPGLAGHLWAVPAARAQSASVLVLAPRTPPQLAGMNRIQEVSGRQPVHLAGPGFYDEVVVMEDVAEIDLVALRLRRLFSRPEGAIVLLCVPTNLLARSCPPPPDLSLVTIAQPAPSAGTIEALAELLTLPGGPPAFLLGSGAIAYRDRLGPLLRRWNAVHFTTPAATAILPGSLGVIGNAAHGDIAGRLHELRVRCVVVLGSRLGEASGGTGEHLLPPNAHVVHIDVDPTLVPGGAPVTRGRRVSFITSGIEELLDALERVEPPAPPHAISIRPEGVT